MKNEIIDADFSEIEVEKYTDEYYEELRLKKKD